MTDAEKLAALRRIAAGDFSRPRVINRLINIGLAEDQRQAGEPFGARIGLTDAGRRLLETR